ncbi:hypothetical protein H310_02652 [Aphanomyces invadans]|uniref:1,3-beta-glucan synthase n=1 Tax=Aphanomyces invadans TaxID=157072 RepID=A0A024UIX5_9STRA|nr:hypothetical protein H310_02652 [Aphanomyces invadans]ETW06376.1 hypothetical protein H310_02652 [Aphanomyces invadans]|eukprot:XP_008864451.1 hypothetical protein H310_02652 [Aphanomyces invadans]
MPREVGGSMHWCAAFVLLATWVNGQDDLSKWIDPVTPLEGHLIDVPAGPYTMGRSSPANNTYRLIFSDEFNTTSRLFEAGNDPKWTALENLDLTNMGQHYFSPQAVQTDEGNLIITTSKPKKAYKGAKYVSGSVQTWNKFCFTGGYIVMRAILPGKWGIPGTWPAFWLMGNIGRATYLGSQDGTWPWSMDTCAPWVNDYMDQPQKINACGNLTDDDDPNSLPERFGLHPRQGRGATEIDVFEVQIKKKDDPAFISTSLQLAPGLHENMRPDPGTLPRPGMWYTNLTYGNYTKINSDYYGDANLDSISALTQLDSNSFKNYHLYSLEWLPGEDGYIRWWLDGNFLYEIQGAALNKWVDGIPPRKIPVEPSYLIISTAVSEKFSPPCDGQLCASLWPSNFTIDYVRVYQGPKNNYTSIGCDPPNYPTKEWIYKHPVWYGLPYYTPLPVTDYVLSFLALVGMVFSAVMAGFGTRNEHLAACIGSSLAATCAFYTLFNVGFTVWTIFPMAVASLCGVVFGLLSCLLPVHSLAGTTALLLSLVLHPFIPLLLHQVITLVVFILAFFLPFFSFVDRSIVVIASTSILGAWGVVGGASRFLNNGQFMVGLWHTLSLLVSGPSTPPELLCNLYCGELYSTWGVLAVMSIVLQLSTYKKPSGTRPPFSPSVAGSDGRAWPASESHTNLFHLQDLPAKMQPFAAMSSVASQVARSFGFQAASVKNQTEHLLVLLANQTRGGTNPFVSLHTTMFENYHHWCHKLQITPMTATPSSSLDSLAADLCLLFFIWGEGSNVRHAPEFLNFLFHKMKQEFGRPHTREPGYFLDAVITPVYMLLKAEMNKAQDHEERRNYDDFNEFFWTRACLKYDYKSPDAHDAPLPPDAPPCIAQAWAATTKTYFEKRHWITPLRAFRRVFEFHLVSFHFLVAVAFADQLDLDASAALHLVSSVLLSPLLLNIVWAGIDLMLMYSPHMPFPTLIRMVVRVIFHLGTTTICSLLYWYALASAPYWPQFYTLTLLVHVPFAFNSVLQVLPGVTSWIRQTTYVPVQVFRDLVSPINLLYVGDNVLDSAADSLGYQFFWVTLLAWNMLFSYKFEIAPLVKPTLLLWADHVENHVDIVLTLALMYIQWFPFFMIFCIDVTIWNALWVAFTGTFVGFRLKIGEIRNYERTRQAFVHAAHQFNQKLIAATSKTGVELAAHDHTYGAAVGGSRSYEVLNVVASPVHTTGNKHDKQELTPLLSFTRRIPSRREKQDSRRRMWTSFGTAWDTVIDSLRADDFISNAEMDLLKFQRIPAYERQLYVPLFQLAGCFEQFCLHLNQHGNVNSMTIHDVLAAHPMMEESVGEVWELTIYILINLLGPCHSNDVRFICAILTSWLERGMYHGIKWEKLAAAADAWSDVLQLLKSNMPSWKAHAKHVPTRKQPSDYMQYTQQQQQQHPTSHLNSIKSSAMHKSASTTGLNTLSSSSNVPRRSRGSGVARIAAMQQIQPPTLPHLKTSIPAVHVMQIRDKLRTFLNVVKGMLSAGMDDPTDVLVSETKAMNDRLTWMLTQERGFMWDDEYTGEQLTLFVFDSHASTAVSHVRGLLTLQKVDAEPKSYDARRRLLFFVNSLFMDMPVAPVLEEMQSYSVMTPFYAEDIMYSKSDLESKQDGLDVHTLLYLQTLYPNDWQNFLERVEPKKNLWKDPNTVQELRLWASMRGQTLARTVQGLMYGEAAIRLLAELENVPRHVIEDLVKAKFTYVVACQVYGRQKRNNDPKAKDIEFLLHRFPNLRVSYIDEVRVNYQKDLSYFTVLIKGTETLYEVVECYRIRLPGNPILGEGKPENQNAAVIFTRGEHLQTIDMNQDGYLEEALKMRNLLEEFSASKRPCTIVGLPEHIFTGSISSLANYMALQETSFVTLGQRTLTRPLRVRMHYGHPDVFNKLFFMTRGGFSKASKGINLSEDIFAGYNNCLRGGTVAFPEYVKCGKGRDVGMQQIYKFEAKLAQGAAEQSLSRDVYRLAHRLDFFKLLSFYYNHVGFYLSMSFVIWTVYVLVYINVLRALLGVEGTGGREAVILSELQVMLGSVAFLTTAPMLATISVERGFKAALSEVFMVVVTGGPMYFLFHIGTKWFYFGQTILAGGAKYRATGRGFVTKHSRFDDLYRFYASSHLYAGFEIAAALVLYYAYTHTTQYVALTWSLWLVVFSWTWSPFWFNPLAFEWSDVLEDIKMWMQWMRGEGGNANQSWLAWFKDENSYFIKLRPWAKALVFSKGFLHAIVGLALLTSADAYHSITAETSYVPLVVMLAMVSVNLFVFMLLFRGPYESGSVRVLKLVFVVVDVAALVAGWSTIPGMIPCTVSFYFFSAAAATWMLLFFGSDNKLAIHLFFVHDCVLGMACLSVIVVLSAIVVPGKVQTWLLYNNALSRGVVIEDILRTNSKLHENDDDLTMVHMKKIILEQQRVIAALTNGSDSDTSDKTSTATGGLKELSRTHVSDTDLSELKDASAKLQQMLNTQQEQKDPHVAVPFQRVRRANSSDFHASKLVPQQQQPLQFGGILSKQP